MKQYLLLLKSSDFNKSGNIWTSNPINLYANSQYKNYSYTRSQYGLNLVGDRTFVGTEVSSPNSAGLHATPQTDTAIYVTNVGEVVYEPATPDLVRFVDTASRVDVLSYRHVFTNIPGNAYPTFNFQLFESDSEAGPWLRSVLASDSNTIFNRDCKPFVQIELEIFSDGLDLDNVGLVLYLEIGIHDPVNPVLSTSTRDILRRFPSWMYLYEDSLLPATPELAIPKSTGGKFLNALVQENLDEIDAQIEINSINSFLNTADVDQLAWSYVSDSVNSNINTITGDDIPLARVSTLSDFLSCRATDYVFYYDLVNRRLITLRLFERLVINGIQIAQEPLNIFNDFDEFGARVGLPRLYLESNANYKKRILDVSINPPAASMESFKRTVRRELDLWRAYGSTPNSNFVGATPIVLEISDIETSTPFFGDNSVAERPFRTFVDNLNERFPANFGYVKWEETVWDYGGVELEGLGRLSAQYDVDNSSVIERTQSGVGDLEDLMLTVNPSQAATTNFQGSITISGIAAATQNYVYPTVVVDYQSYVTYLQQVADYDSSIVGAGLVYEVSLPPHDNYPTPSTFYANLNYNNDSSFFVGNANSSSNSSSPEYRLVKVFDQEGLAIADFKNKEDNTSYLNTVADPPSKKLSILDASEVKVVFKREWDQASQTYTEIPSINAGGGGIVVGGGFSEVDEIIFNGLARVNGDGSLDDSFNIGPGTVGVTYDGYGPVLAMGIQSTGKIIVAGSFLTARDVTVNRIARFNSDGTLDLSWDTSDPTGVGSEPYNKIYELIVLPDDKILIGGYFESYRGTAIDSGLARLNADGSLDGTFTAPSSIGGTEAIAVQPDGKILVGVDYVIRLNEDGTEDLTWDSSYFIDYASTMALQPDGKLLVASYNGNVYRFNTDGTVDETFDISDVKAAFDDYLEVYSIAVQSDGKILLGGYLSTDVIVDWDVELGLYTYVVKLLRLNSDGSEDETWDSENYFLSTTWYVGSVHKIEVDLYDNIIVGGKFDVYRGVTVPCLVKLNPDGTIHEDWSESPAVFSNDAWIETFATESTEALEVDDSFRFAFNEATPSWISNITPGDEIALNDSYIDYTSGNILIGSNLYPVKSELFESNRNVNRISLNSGNDLSETSSAEIYIQDVVSSILVPKDATPQDIGIRVGAPSLPLFSGESISAAYGGSAFDSQAQAQFLVPSSPNIVFRPISNDSPTAAFDYFESLTFDYGATPDYLEIKTAFSENYPFVQKRYEHFVSSTTPSLIVGYLDRNNNVYAMDESPSNTFMGSERFIGTTALTRNSFNLPETLEYQVTNVEFSATPNYIIIRPEDVANIANSVNEMIELDGTANISTYAQVNQRLIQEYQIGINPGWANFADAEYYLYCDPVTESATGRFFSLPLSDSPKLGAPILVKVGDEDYRHIVFEDAATPGRHSFVNTETVRVRSDKIFLAYKDIYDISVTDTQTGVQLFSGLSTGDSYIQPFSAATPSVANRDYSVSYTVNNSYHVEKDIFDSSDNTYSSMIYFSATPDSNQPYSVTYEARAILRPRDAELQIGQLVNPLQEGFVYASIAEYEFDNFDTYLSPSFITDSEKDFMSLAIVSYDENGNPKPGQSVAVSGDLISATPQYVTTNDNGFGITHVRYSGPTPATETSSRIILTGLNSSDPNAGPNSVADGYLRELPFSIVRNVEFNLEIRAVPYRFNLNTDSVSRNTLVGQVYWKGVPLSAQIDVEWAKARTLKDIFTGVHADVGSVTGNADGSFEIADAITAGSVDEPGYWFIAIKVLDDSQVLAALAEKGELIGEGDITITGDIVYWYEEYDNIHFTNEYTPLPNVFNFEKQIDAELCSAPAFVYRHHNQNVVEYVGESPNWIPHRWVPLRRYDQYQLGLFGATPYYIETYSSVHPDSKED